ncbi:MAPEG family protein [Robbsia sp. KACC 23696]|uniref:MAPEG family protein n=1 Tax=Robbsia sp. KACC 23696 TaxID=3149231 RepID=UPI00325BEF1E
MTIDMTILAWVLVLTLVQVMLPAMLRNKETGIRYNASPRDEPGPPVGPVTGRLQRAQKNLMETLPVFIAAVLIVHLAGKAGTLSHIGAALYLIARIVYVPLYAGGVPYVRSYCWLASIAGIVLLLVAML